MTPQYLNMFTTYQIVTAFYVILYFAASADGKFYFYTCINILRHYEGKNKELINFLFRFWFQGIPPNGKLLTGNGPRFIDPDLVCVFDRDCDSISYCRGFRCEVTWWFILIMVLLVVFIIGLVMFGVMWCLGYCRR